MQTHEQHRREHRRGPRPDEPIDLRDPGRSGGVAASFAPLLHSMFPRGIPLRFSFWDGSAIGPEQGPRSSAHELGLRVTAPTALNRLIWAPGELGLGRSYVAGDIDLVGDPYEVLRALQADAHWEGFDPRTVWRTIAAARRLGAFGRPVPPPPEEARPHGILHSATRDAQAISHHYDVGNSFYSLVLGPSMAYSCARYTGEDSTLEQAQVAKFDLVCRKLGLQRRRGMRLLDVGCGWGSLAIHAAQHYGAKVVGITISREQAELARLRVDEAGVSELVEIRLQDYRDLGGQRFEAISSIGMFEHVGSRRMAEYFTVLRGLLVPEGRLLNHAISSIGGSTLGPRTFVGRYVFPDGELIDVGRVLLAMEDAGFEVRDVESLREHYARTLRAWVANLDASWDEAVELVGVGRARVWRLYMAGSALGFDDGGISIHQTLGVVVDETGASGMPATRADFG